MNRRKIGFSVVGLLLVFVLAACSSLQSKEVTILSLTDRGERLLQDDTYGYSIQFPAEWDYLDNHALNQHRDEQSKQPRDRRIETVAALNTATPYESVVIRYAGYRGELSDSVQESQDETGLAFTNGWTQEASTVEDAEAIQLGGYSCYRYRADYVLQEKNLRAVQWNYFIPLSERALALYSFTTYDGDSEGVELFHAAMETLQSMS